MNMALIAGLGLALLVVAGIAVMLTARSRKARAQAEAEAAEALQARRRGAGATLIAGEAPTVMAEEAPRRKADIGLTPWQPDEGPAAAPRPAPPISAPPISAPPIPAPTPAAMPSAAPAPAPVPTPAPAPLAEPAAAQSVSAPRYDAAPSPAVADPFGAEPDREEASLADEPREPAERDEEDWSADDLSALIGAPRASEPTAEPEPPAPGDAPESEDEWSADDLSALIGAPRARPEDESTLAPSGMADEDAAPVAPQDRYEPVSEPQYEPEPVPVAADEEDLGLIEATIPSPEPGSPDEPPSILSQLKKKKKGGGANPLAGAVEGGPADHGGPQVSAPREVEESVTLVVRRRVGLADGAMEGEVRSWLGGLPMMPEGIAWPRSVAPERPDEGEVPLNFVGQFCCADFPEELWGGLGPRSGWLLVFLNPRDSMGDDPRLFKVIHIDALGPERQPPEDAKPVHDEVYAGADYRHFRSADDIPSQWRKWPVDLVAMPNQAYQDGEKIIVAPRDLVTQLYGALADDERPSVGPVPPFSWRGALHVVDSILRELDQPFAPPPVSPGIREALSKPGYIQSLIPILRQEEDSWLAEGDGAILLKEEPLTQRQREAKEAILPIAEARKARFEQTVRFIADHHTADKMIERIDGDARAEAGWRLGARDGLESVRQAILARDLDSRLEPADWEALAGHLDGERFTRWTLSWASRNSSHPVALEPMDTSLLDLGAAGMEAAVVEVAADYYGDPALRALVPEGIFEALEPYWRKLLDNRPHRIGGFHDGLQSDPEPGAQPEVLLLQLASDEAMTMMWGDEGAYFIFISPQDLANGRYDQANIRLECY